MRHRIFYIFTIVIFCAISIVANSRPAAAINYNRLMYDSVFDTTNTMSASAIDSWLNSKFPSSCISTNKKFTAPDPIGYSEAGGFKFGSSVSAGRVIYDSAQAYGINPQVLLATLQKEQSLVSGAGGICSDPFTNTARKRYVAAMGYGCPDSGTSHSYTGLNLYSINGTKVTSVSSTCVNTSKKAGFSQQVIRAAWLLKFSQQRSLGNINWAVIKGNWDNSDDLDSCYSGPMTQGFRKRCPSDTAVFYDGYTTIDGASVHMDTGATAALYWYTPHKSGNLHFVDIFTSWFGSTQYKYAADITEQHIYSDAARTNELVSIPTRKSGEKLYFTIKAKNTGIYTWSQSITKVATVNNRPSVFADDSWISTKRAALLQEASVAPSAFGTFKFSMSAPVADGNYNEAFTLVEENKSWILGNSSFSFNITVANPFNAKFTEIKEFTDSNYTKPIEINKSWMSHGQVIYVRLKAKNTGTQTWNQAFTKVGTATPQDRASVFADGTWLSNGRPTDLEESTVAPGQTGTFKFTLKAPNADDIYAEDFKLVADGQSSGWMPGTLFTKSLNVVSAPPDDLASNQRLYYGYQLKSENGNYRLILQKDGNLVLYSTKRAIWATHTNGNSADYLQMQSDGNLVLHRSTGGALWSSHTNGHSGAKFVVQNDGNMVIYYNGHSIWSSNTRFKI